MVRLMGSNQGIWDSGWIAPLTCALNAQQQRKAMFVIKTGQHSNASI